MSKIFICYRRSDTGYQPESIKEKMDRFLGSKAVFYDHDILPGEKWQEVLNQKINASKAMIVLIGQEWLTDKSGRNRLFDDQDFVRYEIEQGIAKSIRDKDYKIHTLLFDGVKMPATNDLPESIRQLTSFNALEIDYSEMDSKLYELGEMICKDIHGPFWCLIIKYKKILLGLLLLLPIIFFVYNWVIDKPRCEKFSFTEDLKIILASNDHNITSVFQNQLSAKLKPVESFISSFKGKIGNVDQSKLNMLSLDCEANLVVYGTPSSCRFDILDKELKNYIESQLGIDVDLVTKSYTDIDLMSCIIKCFKYRHSPNKKFNFNSLCVNLNKKGIDTISRVDTMSMILNQSAASIYEQEGKLDTALQILQKMGHTGGINPDSIFTRMSRIASKTHNTAAEIIAKTGLVNQAETKGDEKTKLKLQTDIDKLSIKLNREQDNQILAPPPPPTTVKPSGNSSLGSTNPNSNQQSDMVSGHDNLTTSSSSGQILSNGINTNANIRLYEKLSTLIKKGNWQEIQRVYEKNKEKIDGNHTYKSLYYESLYKAKLIKAEEIPSDIFQYNTRLKTDVIIEKMKTKK